MKQLLVILLSVLHFSVLSAQDILPKPNPPQLVNDAAGVLSTEQKDILERKLVALDDSTSNQIAVVLIKTLHDYPIEEYAVKLFRDWGIGNKKTNNGVLLIAAIDDHKVRIEIGYGLEGAIPDITTASIIRNDIAPNFKEGNYFRGIDQATNSLAAAAAGEYKVKRNKNHVNGSNTIGDYFKVLLIIIFIIFFLMSRGRTGGGGIWLGGGGFGGGGFNSGGFGGGGDSGGFGGFGGGSSGGGGASGSW